METSDAEMLCAMSTKCSDAYTSTQRTSGTLTVDDDVVVVILVATVAAVVGSCGACTG